MLSPTQLKGYVNRELELKMHLFCCLAYPEGWGGQGGGRGFRIVGHMYTHGWFMLMYGKYHYILKQLASN